MPTWIPPMLATLTDVLPTTGKWVYEPKLDGVRALRHPRRANLPRRAPGPLQFSTPAFTLPPPSYCILLHINSLAIQLQLTALA